MATNRKRCRRMQYNKKQVDKIKERYSKGTPIKLLEMRDDPRPVEPGTCGTVTNVDDIGTVHCKFDDGRVLGLVVNVDRFIII